MLVLQGTRCLNSRQCHARLYYVILSSAFGNQDDDPGPRQEPRASEESSKKITSTKHGAFFLDVLSSISPLIRHTTHPVKAVCNVFQGSDH